MRRRFVWSAAVLAFSLGVLPSPVLAEEDDQPPPPPERPEGGPQRRGPERNAFLSSLTKEERAKLTALAQKVADALTAYKAKANEETKKNLATQVAAFIECHQQLVIVQAERATAQAKQRLADKDREAARQTEQLLSMRRENGEEPPRREGPDESSRRKHSDSSGSKREKGDKKDSGKSDRQNSAEHILIRLLMLNSVTPAK